MPSMTFKTSPRLWVTADVASNLQTRLHSPYLKDMARCVLRDADRLVKSPPLKEGVGPAWGVAGRWVQSHLECLTAAWILKREKRHRQAAIKHLEGLLKWNQISCEARTNTPPEPRLPFCLTYGEQSTAIALMYDHFRADLTGGEQRVFFDVIDRFHLAQAVKCLTSPPWWANKAWSNWNGVCAGGMGLLALAFHDDRPEARELVPFVEKSLGEYFSSYIANDGGCPEGTGYWNYGMNYAMRYVLSWENATGQKHPALEIKELGESLFFPVDFTGLTFGDNDGWHPSGFYFLMAQRTGLRNAALRAAAFLPERLDVTRQRISQSYLGATKPGQKALHPQHACNGELLYAADAMPTVEEMKKLRAEHAKKKIPVARVYKGMDWATLADDQAFPSLRMSIRGGTAKIAGHGMVDLLSFRNRINGELFITDQLDSGYLIPTFGKRGHELYARSAESKSTLFVEGLGCMPDATCLKTEGVGGRGVTGVRIDATHNYMPPGRIPAKFIGRLFLFVENSYWLVIDHVLGNNEVAQMCMESRFHTYAKHKRAGNHVALTSGREKMQMTFAALEVAAMQESRGTPPLPGTPQTTILRWMTTQRRSDNLHVVAMNPGAKKIGVKVSRSKDGVYMIDVARPGSSRRRIRLTAELRLA